MNVTPIIKSTQEQGIAAWIDYLNQLRLSELLEKLASQDMNLEKALSELQKMKVNIAALIESNRGGEKGIHGYIAEAAEVGIENARNLIKGLDAVCEWVNDNGPTDIIRNGTEIQQKFVQAGGHFGLEKIKEHLEKYPDYIKTGGKYQIPKDFYDKLQRLLALSQEEAAKESESTYKLWKWVHTFFEENEITPDDLEPAVLDYSAVQIGKIDETVNQEEDNIKAEDENRRKEAYDASKPTLKQGVKAAMASSAVEGGTAFCLGIAKKLKQGKHLANFTSDDWKEVGIDTAKGSVQGGIRGGTIYIMTNFTATPAAVANALVTASFGIVAQAHQFQQGNITTEDFIINSEVLCLDVSVSAVASMLGQAVIPVPILGAVIGNMTGMFMYQIAKDHLSANEQALIDNYRENFTSLNKMLDEQYQKLIEQLEKELAKYASLLELAFDVDVNKAFEGSIALADYVGVPPGKVLRTQEDIDDFFTN
ncbi:MAG: hypothetical protein NC313_12670 [Butyrivibrio sp.]|nr:hypothetical protein [Butyrivibrio sp.]